MMISEGELTALILKANTEKPTQCKFGPGWVSVSDEGWEAAYINMLRRAETEVPIGLDTL